MFHVLIICTPYFDLTSLVPTKNCNISPYVIRMSEAHVTAKVLGTDRNIPYLRLLFMQRSYPEIFFKLHETVTCDLL